jgi:hypothetical protein
LLRLKFGLPHIIVNQDVAHVPLHIVPQHRRQATTCACCSAVPSSCFCAPPVATHGGPQGPIPNSYGFRHHLLLLHYLLRVGELLQLTGQLLACAISP